MNLFFVIASLLKIQYCFDMILLTWVLDRKQYYPVEGPGVAEWLDRRRSNRLVPGSIPGPVRTSNPLTNGSEGRTSLWHVDMCCNPVCLGGD